MKSYHLDNFNSINGIILKEEDIPKLGDNEILVRVMARSLNKRDIAILYNSYPLPPTKGIVPVSDGVGEIIEIGENVIKFKVGDRVVGSYFPNWIDGDLNWDIGDQLGCTLNGMLSEYAFLNESWVVKIPEYLSWEEASTLPCAGLTAWNSLFGIKPIIAGDSVLTIGTGGVSLYSLQLAKLAGCKVICITSSKNKVEKLKRLGADVVINSTEQPEWGNVVNKITNNNLNLIVETGGSDTIEQSMRAIGFHGHVVLLLTRSVTKLSIEISNEAYSRKLATIHRVFAGSRTDLEALIQSIENTKLHPIIDKTFEFKDSLNAFDYYMNNRVFGKVVITN